MVEISMFEIQETFSKVLYEIEPRNRKYIHPKSVQNFIQYFHSLSDKSKSVVEKLLLEYCEELKLHADSLPKKMTIKVFANYLMQIGAIYEKELAFKTMMDWGFILKWGIVFDACLFFVGVSKFYFHLPLVLIVLIIRKFYYLKIETNNKMYGLFY
jgi:hypothetical protein